MPTIHRSGPYRLFFYSSDGDEPPHVHVERDAMRAKLWIAPPGLAWNDGFAPSELRKLEALVQAHAGQYLEAWNGYFNG